MRINNNLMAMNTHRQLGINNSAGAKSIEKLSSGYRINRAGDDAAGLSISEKMRAQIRGLNQASRNSQDSISLIQTAEGALNETQAILQRMRELAVQSANDTNVTVDREAIQQEITQLTSEINRIGETTEFNTMKLLDGSVSTTSRAQASSIRTIAATGVYTANHSDNAVQVGIDGDVFDDGQITLAAAITTPGGAAIGTFDGTATSTQSTFKISKTASNQFTVELQVVGTAGATLLTSTETYTITDGVDFAYDNHGISFDISSANFDSFDSTGGTSSVTISFDNADLGGTLAAATDWDSNTAGSTITSGFTFDPAVEVEGAVKVVISQSNTGALTVDFLDANSASITTDVYELGTGVNTLAYDHHGLQFDYATTLTAAGSAKITVNFDTKTTTASSVVVDNSLVFQVGSNESQTMGLSLSDMRAQSLGISSSAAGVDGEAGFVATSEVTDGTNSTASEFALDVTSSAAAQAAITTINDALESVSAERAKLGAVQNRLEHTIKNLDTSSENLLASESRIRDVDMAKEMMEFTKNNILQQAAQAMLAQANQAPQGVLQLLR